MLGILKRHRGAVAVAVVVVAYGALLLPTAASAQSANNFAGATNNFESGNAGQNVGGSIPVGVVPITATGTGSFSSFLPQQFTGAAAGVTVLSPDEMDLSAEEKAKRGALLALPTKKPPLAELGLTIIPLSIDGQACGVLGLAGAVDDGIATCGKSPINVSGIADALP